MMKRSDEVGARDEDGKVSVRLRKTPSAIGERQMFPRQTKRTEVGRVSVPETTIVM